MYNCSQQLQNIALEDLQFTISDHLFLDVLLVEIRSKTIACSQKKKKKKEKEQRLEKEIQNWESKTSLSEEEIRLLQEKKQRTV